MVAVVVLRFKTTLETDNWTYKADVKLETTKVVLFDSYTQAVHNAQALRDKFGKDAYMYVCEAVKGLQDGKAQSGTN